MSLARFVAIVTLPVVVLLAGPALADGKVYSNGGTAINGYHPVA